MEGKGHIDGRQNCFENLRQRHKSAPEADKLEFARKAIVAQAAKSFGALRVDTKEDFSSLTLLVAFDDREKATAFQEDCNKQPLLRVLEGVPNGARRFN